MRKLTFERAVLIVFIMIILISTSDITGKYIEIWTNKGYKPPTTNTSGANLGFPTMLLKADDLFKNGDYEGASKEYFTITLNNTLSPEQKVYAYFRLGISHYNLKNYDLAADSFIKVTSFNADDSLAYNNAAISYYRAKDMKKAVDMQRKALDILPAVEYYYNLARMYEDNEEYGLAVDNYMFVAAGEKNLSKVERIDPVRVKEKIARLTTNNKTSVSPTVNNILRVYKLDDNREILTINENEMRLREGDFIVRVENLKTTKNIIAEYNKSEYDPYNLISELVWTIYKDGKAIYKKTSNQIKYATPLAGNYEVRLNIKYNGSNEKIATKTVRITETQSTVVDRGTIDEIVVKPAITKEERVYPGAIYEQLFGSNFVISGQGYTDKYNVVWGIDNEVQAELYDVFFVDRPLSLEINNNSSVDKGIWVNLDSLLKDNNIKGKTIKLNFYARRMTRNAKVNLIVRVKSEGRITITQDIRNIDDSWQHISSVVFIPENATGLTISINTAPNEQFNIDGFTVIK